MLSTALLEETSREFGVATEREAGGGTEGEERDSRLTNNCIFYCVHFDEFYPPDLREQGVNDIVTLWALESLIVCKMFN